MRRAAVLLGTLVAASVGSGLGGEARATTYAYWSYWHKAPGSSSWSYSNTGPFYYRPADGSVEGWHFVHGSATPADPPPRASGSYPALCGSKPSSAAGTQVAVVIDNGSSVARACVTVSARSTGTAVLTAAGATQRYNSSGLLCAINGYPRTGCGTVESGPAPSPSGTTKPPARMSSSPSGSRAGGSTPGARSRTASPPRPASSPATVRRRPTAGSSSVRPAVAVARSAAGGPSSAAASAAASGDPSFAPVATRAAGSDSGGPPWGLLVGGALIAAVGGAAAVRARRRRA